MKLIPLTHDKFAQVDDEDFEYLNQFKWHYKEGRGNSTGYAARGVNLKNGKTDCIKMHRVVMGCKKYDGKLIDHKDGDGLNCQKLNLRACNYSENGRNRKAYGSSKYLGVSLISRKNGTAPYYAVNATFNKKRVFLGQFPNTTEGEIKAASAYNEFAVKNYGEFAKLNEI